MTNLITTPFDGGPPIGHTAGRNVRAAPVIPHQRGQAVWRRPDADPPCNLAGTVSFEWQSWPLFGKER